MLLINKLAKNKKRIVNMFIYILFLFLLIGTISLKINYHIDEFYSFNLANHEGISSIDIKDNVKYESYSKIFLEYTSVQNNNRFNIKNVFNNQANDVHPPLYYLLLNFICSLNPNTFSKWYPAIINIIAALISLIFVQKIIKELTDNSFILYSISLLFILSNGILTDAAYFRMYMLSMMWVSIVTYLIVSNLDTNNNSIFIKIGIATYMGALTHYYCIFYFMLISFSYGVYLLANKKYRCLLKYCFTMAITGICVYFSFPAMISQVFSGYRGEEAVSNLFNINDYIDRFIIFFKQISRNLFGNLLLVILVTLFLLILYFFIIKKNTIKKDILSKYILLLIPTIIYYIVVVKIAAYLNERYFSIIYPLIIVCVFCLMFTIIDDLCVKNSKVIIGLVSLVVIICGFIFANWEYLYRDTETLVNGTKQYNNVDCVCIHSDNKTNILYNSIELMNYNNIIFIDESNVESINVWPSNDTLIIKLIGVNNQEECLNIVINMLDQYRNYKLIGSGRNGSTYFLY